MTVLVVIVLGLSLCSAQIPKECGTNFTLKTGICCPLSTVNNGICGFPERGDCEPVEIYEREVEMFEFQDVRFRWPMQWFRYMCKCKGHYFGASCDDCWYGRTGPNCSEIRTIIRRNILSYNDSERRQFIAVLLATREEPSPYLLVKEAYQDSKERLLLANINEVIVNIHFLAQRSIITDSAEMCLDVPYFDFAHGNVGFLTYHRHLMMLWEKWTADMARRVFGIENFSFPYWDWTDKKVCEVCTNDLIGAQGEISAEGSNYLSEDSRFHFWKVYCDVFNVKEDFTENNCAPCSVSSQSARLTRKMTSSLLPTAEHVAFTLSRRAFAPDQFTPETQSQCPAFTKALEGVCGREEWNLKFTMHNAVHSSVIGPFSETATSPNDPLFILHHTQIDRLFQRWWLSHPSTVKSYPRTMTPGHCFQCNQVGFLPVVAHKRVFTDARELGYDYDSLTFGSL